MQTGARPKYEDAFRRRLHILSVTYRNHRFERRSPIPPLSAAQLASLLSVELVFPPRRELMQPGLQTIDGLFALGSIASWVDAKTIFEIGTFRGLTTWFLARNRPHAEVHTLDIPPEDQPSFELDPSDEFRAAPQSLYYMERGENTNVVQHWSDSAVFDFSSWRGKCDLVYIDGSHSAPYVRSDSRNAFEMLSSNGAVVWDDYWRMSPGTVAVLHELLEQGTDLFRIPNTRLVVHLTPEARDRLRTA